MSAVSNLVRHHKVPESNVVKLSSYQAQCELITKGLLQQGLTGIEVNTVLQSQG